MRDRAIVLACLFACGAFPVAMLVARSAVDTQFSYGFLLWNLFLAALPVPFALVVESAWRTSHRTLGGVFFVGWLLLFPNAPYLITDLIHLRESPPAPLWYDALILASAAVAGLLAAFVSLHLVQSAVTRKWGPARGWLLAVLLLGLSGFGVYLGRFVRLNSWHVITRPRGLLHDVGSAVAVSDSPRAVIVTVLFSSFLIVTYATVEMLSRLTPATAAPVVRS